MTAKKRTFTPEYKAECVGLVRDGERSISAVAKELGLSDAEQHYQQQIYSELSWSA